MFRMFVCSVAFYAPVLGAAEKDAHRDIVAPFLKAHCARCHEGEKPKTFGTPDIKLKDLDMTGPLGELLA